MKKSILILLSFLGSLSLMSQNGGAWVKQYDNATIESILPITNIKQDPSGALCFINKQGEQITYDGISWKSIKAVEPILETPVSVYKQAVKQLGDSVMGIFPLSRGKWMAALQSGTLYVGNQQGFTLFPSEATAYLKTFGVSCGAMVPNEQIALATNQGGILLINAKNGAITDRISLQSGLDDDRVTALGVDSNGSLWASTATGVNHILIDLPIRNFAIYPGIEGFITDIVTFRDTLYVATTKGLFRLVPVSVVEQVMPYLKRELRHKEQVTYIRSTKEISKLVRISFVNKSNNQDKIISQEIPIKIEVPFDSVVNSYGVEFPSMDARRLYASTQLQWKFEKITQVLGSVRHLQIADSSLLSACSDGLYEIKGSNVHQILGSEDVSGVAYLPNNVLVCVGSIGMTSFIKGDKQWQKMTDNLSVQGNCSFICTVNKNEVWLTTEKGIYSVQIDTLGAFSNLKNYSTVNIENPVLVDVKNILVACAGKGYYKYDSKKAGFVQTRSVNVGVISNQMNNVWTNDSCRWISATGSTATEAQLLSFLNPSLLYNDSALWTVSGGEIYKISGNYKQPSTQVYLSAALDRNNKSVLNNSIELTENNNGLHFTWASNWFVTEEKCLYRYRILGLDSRWSAWSPNPQVTYPFLPAGSYKIELQMKTADGTIATSKPIKLSVSGNFIKQYGLYLLLGALAVLCILLFILLQKAKRK